MQGRGSRRQGTPIKIKKITKIKTIGNVFFFLFLSTERNFHFQKNQDKPIVFPSGIWPREATAKTKTQNKRIAGPPSSGPVPSMGLCSTLPLPPGTSWPSAHSFVLAPAAVAGHPAAVASTQGGVAAHAGGQQRQPNQGQPAQAEALVAGVA